MHLSRRTTLFRLKVVFEVGWKGGGRRRERPRLGKGVDCKILKRYLSKGWCSVFPNQKYYLERAFWLDVIMFISSVF